MQAGVFSLKTNWVKSQLHPGIWVPTTFPFCMTWHPQTHQRGGNTRDGDYWLVIADLIVSLSQKDEKNNTAWQNHNSVITTLADIQRAILGDQFLQSIMYRFYSPSEMQSWWSQGAHWHFEVQKSRSERWKIHSPGFSPLRSSDLKWAEWN